MGLFEAWSAHAPGRHAGSIASRLGSPRRDGGGGTQVVKRAARNWLAGASTVVAGAAGWYALRVETDLVELTRTRLEVPLWSGVSANILFLSDTHHWDWGLREERVLAALRSATHPPDLIVWGGDYVGHDCGVPTAIRFCGAVRSCFPKTPMVAVRGNAEHKLSVLRRAVLESGMADSGVEWLVNESRRSTLAGADIQIAGCDDPYYGFCDLDRTFSQLDGRHPVLLVAHSPQVVARAAEWGIGLVLSGHTHGGQVRLAGVGALRTQNPQSRRIDMGVYDRKRLTHCLGRDPGSDTVLFVGRGIGLAFVPKVPWLAPRMGCRPEVAWLDLRPSGRSVVDGPDS